MQEFICPNGRMSVNGVCPIFEGDDGQIKDFQTPKTFDQKYNDIEDIEKEREKSGFFKFDFEKETPSAKKSAGNIISENIGAYNSFVENNLGISSSVQNVARIGSAISGFGSYGVVGAIAPFAIPFVAGAALNNRENNRVQDITMQDTQGDIQTTPARIMNIQPTAQDIYRGGGGDRGSSGPTAQAGGFASDGGPVSNQTGRGRVGF